MCVCVSMSMCMWVWVLGKDILPPDMMKTVDKGDLGVCVYVCVCVCVCGYGYLEGYVAPRYEQIKLTYVCA